MKYQRIDYIDGFEIWEVGNHFKKERLIYTTFPIDEYPDDNNHMTWACYSKPSHGDRVSYLTRAEAFLIIL